MGFPSYGLFPSGADVSVHQPYAMAAEGMRVLHVTSWPAASNTELKLSDATESLPRRERRNLREQMNRGLACGGAWAQTSNMLTRSKLCGKRRAVGTYQVHSMR